MGKMNREEGVKISFRYEEIWELYPGDEKMTNCQIARKSLANALEQRERCTYIMGGVRTAYGTCL